MAQPLHSEELDWVDPSAIVLEGEYAVSIAGVTVHVQAPTEDLALEVFSPYERFAVAPGCGDLTLTAHYGEVPLPARLDEPIFDSGSLWRLYPVDGRYLLTLSNPARRFEPYAAVYFSRSLDEGDIYFRESSRAESYRHRLGKPAVCPFRHPIDEMLVINHLADGRGVDLHCCAVANDGCGALFIGASGAGKSTLAGLLDGRPLTVLTDDRAVVRAADGGLVAYGTPWHGDACVAEPLGVPLTAVCFLKKSDSNHLRRLSSADATTRLLVCSFPTFYFKEGMERTMSLLEEIGMSVPAYEFGFVPDSDAADFLLGEAAGLLWKA